MNNDPKYKDDKFYFMKLKKNISKGGKVYYTGKYAYAIDILGFEKEDGTISLWLKPQPMDQAKQAFDNNRQGSGQNYSPKTQAAVNKSQQIIRQSPPRQNQYQAEEPPAWDEPMPGAEDDPSGLPF